MKALPRLRAVCVLVSMVTLVARGSSVALATSRLPWRQVARLGGRLPAVRPHAEKELPTANADFEAWTQVHRTVVARAFPHGTRFAVARPAFTGGIDQNSDTLVYTTLHDLGLYDLAKRRHLPVPTAISDLRGYLIAPTISDGTILFSQWLHSGVTKIELYVEATDSVKTLARANDLRFLVAGQVNGDWATWSDCSTRCDTFRYDIDTGKTTKIPRPRGHKFSQSDSAVSPAGVVYFVRDTLLWVPCTRRQGCLKRTKAVHSRIYRWEGSRSSRVITSQLFSPTGRGAKLGDLFLFDNAGPEQTLFLDTRVAGHSHIATVTELDRL
jgi:hypothetical protein